MNETNVNETVNETPNTNPSSENKVNLDEISATVPGVDQNIVFIRGLVRGISQTLDDDNQPRNIISVTTPNPTGQDIVKTAVLNIDMGNNNHASELRGEIQTGDHVEIKAQLRTYRSRDRQNMVQFVATDIKKSERDGISGLGDYKPDMNEEIFSGIYLNLFQPDPNKAFAILNMRIEYEIPGRKTAVCFPPSVIFHGAYLRALNDQRKKIMPNRRVCVICHMSIRDQANGKQKYSFIVHGLRYFDDEGNEVTVSIPERRPYRIPRNNRNVVARNVVARTNTAEELSKMNPAAQADPEVPKDDLNAVISDMPASVQNNTSAPESTKPVAAQTTPAPTPAPVPAVESRTPTVQEMAARLFADSDDDDIE